MSEPLRVAFVAEGPTDLIMLEAVAKSLLGGHDFVPTRLQPEVSEAFAQAMGTLGGWSGVYRWCKQAADQGGGRVSQSPLFASHDVLIVQVDADVAEKTYASGRIEEAIQDLPCQKRCPPANDTTNALRTVVLRWMGESSVPARTALCTPSKSLEAWVLAALLPRHRWVSNGTLECRANPEKQLVAAQPRGKRIRKDTPTYRAKAVQFAAAWPHVKATCTEAARFSDEFVRAIPRPPR